MGTFDGDDNARFCDAEGCEGNGGPDDIETVEVSVNGFEDETRDYCASCKQVFENGVQHGVFLALCAPHNALVQLVKDILKGKLDVCPSCGQNMPERFCEICGQGLVSQPPRCEGCALPVSVCICKPVDEDHPSPTDLILGNDGPREDYEDEEDESNG